MSRSALITAFMATTIAAQASFAVPGFQYVGCVEADPANFGVNIDFVKAFTPQECQKACAGKAHYAALGGGCHCDVPSDKAHQPVKFALVDESKCDVPCIKDAPKEGGSCGGAAGKDGKQVYNLYKMSDKGHHVVTRTVTEDCEDNDVMAKTKFVEPTSTTTETVIECPTEVPDCPARSTTHPPPPPPSCPAGCIPAIPGGPGKPGGPIPTHSAGETAIFPPPPAGTGAASPPPPPASMAHLTTMLKPCHGGDCHKQCPPGCLPEPAPPATSTKDRLPTSFPCSTCKPTKVCPSGGCDTLVTSVVPPPPMTSTAQPTIMTAEAAPATSRSAMAGVMVLALAATLYLV